MALDSRTLTSELRAELAQRAVQAEDPYERARAAERVLRDALARARAQVWKQCHWWGRDGSDAAS